MWEGVEAETESTDRYFKTHRLKVPGGWLVRIVNHGVGLAMAFVSDPAYGWELKSKK